MDRKLGDFRARRQSKRTGREQLVSPSAAEGASDNPQNDNEGGWITDSSLGRWLSTRRYDLANITLLKVLLWVVLLSFFIELEFGLPFFVVSLFYWLYEGLRDPGEREPGEMSAYSVFNPDCEPLLGALTAEQMEAEMGYKPLANI